MQNVETIHDRVRLLVATVAGGKNTVFAQKLGVNEANIRGYVKNIEPKADFLDKVVRTYDISAEWLLTGRGEMLKGQPVDRGETLNGEPMGGPLSSGGQSGSVDRLLGAHGKAQVGVRQGNPSSVSVPYGVPIDTTARVSECGPSTGSFAPDIHVGTTATTPVPAGSSPAETSAHLVSEATTSTAGPSSVGGSALVGGSAPGSGSAPVCGSSRLAGEATTSVTGGSSRLVGEATTSSGAADGAPWSVAATPVARRTASRAEGVPLIPAEAMAAALAGDPSVTGTAQADRYVIPLFRDADFLIPVKGSSMQPHYGSGDIVACRRIPLTDLFFQWGKVYVIDTAQGVLVKRVKPGTDPTHVLIVSDNPSFDPFELPTSAIRAVALVIGSIRLE